SSSCRETNTWWPRFCAARIIVTVVSLYALSESGASMTNRNRAARLLALFLLLRGRGGGLLEAGAGGGGHERHGARDLDLGQGSVAALRRHRALALGRALHERGEALLDARRPVVLVADLRRPLHAARVPGRPGRLRDRSAAARARRRGGRADLDARYRLDALGDALGCHRR